MSGSGTHILDLTPILETPGASIDVAGVIPASEFVVGAVEFKVHDGFHYDLSASHTGDGILVSGTVRADVSVPCSRCLEEFDSVLGGDVSLYYVFESEDERDDEVEVLVGTSLDVQSIVWSTLTESAPFAPVCDEACKGICPICGTDLNAGSCECDMESVEDSPFAALRGMFDDGDETDTDEPEA